MRDKIKEFEDAFCKALIEDKLDGDNDFVAACQEYSHKKITNLLSEELVPKIIKIFGVFCNKYNLTKSYSPEEMQTILQGPMLEFVNATLMSVIKSAIDSCTINTTVQVVDENNENTKSDPVTFVKVDRVVH